MEYFSDLQEILKLVNNNDPIDSFAYHRVRQEEIINNIYFPPEQHSIFRIDLRGSRLQKLISNSIIKDDLTRVVWFRKNNHELIEMRTSELDGVHDTDILYCYGSPQESKIDVDTFIELITHLRSAEGCPWDRKQTHQSLRTNLIEETYEVLEAIDQNDYNHLREELGDLLLQIVLHAQIAAENGKFEIGHVIHDIYQKLLNRHPHVFANSDVHNIDAVLTNWEKIKENERNNTPQDTEKSMLGSIPKQLPALSIAQKYQERASRVGFDWEDIAPVFQKVFEEIQEVQEAQGASEIEGELGDLLFAVVNLVRWSGFDAETALRLTNNKFQKRFQYIEKKVSDNGQSLSDLTLSEMDAFWDEAKI